MVSKIDKLIDLLKEMQGDPSSLDQTSLGRARDIWWKMSDQVRDRMAVKYPNLTRDQIKELPETDMQRHIEASRDTALNEGPFTSALSGLAHEIEGFVAPSRWPNEEYSMEYLPWVIEGGLADLWNNAAGLYSYYADPAGLTPEQEEQMTLAEENKWYRDQQDKRMSRGVLPPQGEDPIPWGDIGSSFGMALGGPVYNHRYI